jgi:hypothetical protein
MPRPVFLPGEREAIDAVVSAFAAAAREAGHVTVRPETPFLEHARKERKRLSRDGRPARQGDIAALLLEWARNEGDVRLYAYRPIDRWFAGPGAGVGFAPEIRAAAAEAVARVSTDFTAFARQAIG